MLWSAESCAPLSVLALPSTNASSLSWLPDGATVVGGRTYPRRSSLDPAAHLDELRGRFVRFSAQDITPGRVDERLRQPDGWASPDTSPDGTWHIDLVKQELQRTEKHPLGAAAFPGDFHGMPRWSDRAGTLVVERYDEEQQRTRTKVFSLEGGRPLLVTIPDCVAVEPSHDGRRVACVDPRTRRLRIVDLAKAASIFGPVVPPFTRLRWAGTQIVALPHNGPDFFCFDSQRGTLTGQGRAIGDSHTVNAGDHFARIRSPIPNKKTVFTIADHRLELEPGLTVVEDGAAWRAVDWAALDIKGGRPASVSPDAIHAVVRMEDGEWRIVTLDKKDADGQPAIVLRLPRMKSARFTWIAPGLMLISRAPRGRWLWSKENSQRLLRLRDSLGFASWSGRAPAGRWSVIAGVPTEMFDGQRLWPLRARRPASAESAFDPSGQFFALVSVHEVPGEESEPTAQTVALYDLRSGTPQLIERIEARYGSGWLAAGRYALGLAHDEQFVTILDLVSHKRSRQVGGDATATPGAGGLAVLGSDIVRFERDTLVERVPCQCPHGRGFSADGRWLLGTYEPGTVVCEVATGRAQFASGGSWLRLFGDYALSYGEPAGRDRLVRLDDGKELTIEWIDVADGRFEPLVLDVAAGTFDAEPGLLETLWLTDGQTIFRGDQRPNARTPGMVERFLRKP